MHPLRFELEAFSVGDLPEAARSGVEQHMRGCETCATFLTGLEHDRDALLATRPPAAFARALHAHAGSRRRKAVWTAWALAMAAASASVIFAVWPQPAGDLRMMGGAGVELFLQRGERVVQVGKEATVGAGDALQVVLTLPRRSYVSLFFIDAAGDVSWLVPGEAGGEAATAERGEWRAPASAVFDSSPLRERLVVVVREKRFVPAELVESLRRRLHADPPAFAGEAWLHDVAGATTTLFVKR